MKILHTADLHIDSPMRGLARYDGAPVERLQIATRRAVEALVDLAVGTPVDLVVIAGDVFDGDWKDFRTGLFWISQIARLHDHNIPVVFIAGNHDAASEISRRLQLPPNTRQLSTDHPETVVFDDLDVAVVGQSYATRAVTDDLAARYPVADPGRFTLGLLHTSLDGRPGHDPYAPTTLDMLRGLGYDYWALGHVHQREIVSEDPWVVFSGNLQGRHARETGPKGATLITVGDDHTIVDVAHHVLDVARWSTISIDCARLDLRPDGSIHDTFDTVAAAVDSALSELRDTVQDRFSAVRVELRGSTPVHGALLNHREHLTAEIHAMTLRHRDVWVEKIRIATETPPSAMPEFITDLRAQVAQLRRDGLGEDLEKTFQSLRSKLPTVLKRPDRLDDSMIPASPEHIDQLMDEAADYVAALLSAGNETLDSRRSRR